MVSEYRYGYVQKTTCGITFLTLYVDDILLARNNMKMIQITKWLSSVFKMKDLGEVSYVLGLKITRNRPKKLFALSQEAHINKILECFQMHYSKPMNTPIEKDITLSLDQFLKLDKENNKTMSSVPYEIAIRNLMYTMLYIQLDIFFAIGLVSCYQSNPRPAYWQAIKRIFC